MNSSTMQSFGVAADRTDDGRPCLRQNVAHPFLITRIANAAEVDAIYEAVLSLSEYPWLSDHCLGEVVVVPGSAVAEFVRAAAEDHFGFAPEIKGLVFRTPITLECDRARYIRVVVNRSGARASVFSSAEASRTTWILHAVARIGPCQSSERIGRIDVKALRKRCTETVNVAALYENLGSTGLRYGPLFRGLRTLACCAGEALGDIRLPDDAEVQGYGMHPALLDAALHVAAGVAPVGSEAWIPFEVGQLVVYETERREALVHARLVSGRTANTRVINIIVMDADGMPIVVMSTLVLRCVSILMAPDAPVSGMIARQPCLSKTSEDE
jgi:acyl transferase domain-containing protein